MQPFGCLSNKGNHMVAFPTTPSPAGRTPMRDMDAVFKALSDPARRRLLDRLNERSGLTLTELCEDMGMTRQSVSKHLAVLEEAEVVTTIWRGREKLHYLNAAP